MQHTNLKLNIILTLLSITGCLAIFSVAPDRLLSQVVFLISGFILYIYIAKQQYTIYENLGIHLYILSIVLLTITFILGRNIRGSTRWIDIGFFRLQASEITKPLLIISFSSFLKRWKPKNIKNILINTLLATIPIALIFMQPDLGTALIYLAIWTSMLFIAGLPANFVISLFAIFILSIGYIPKFLHSYQLDRIKTFIDPYSDPLGSGYNVIQSMIAIGSGGVFGKGLKEGTQSQLRFLPERHTDFIFASIGEEFGLVGSGAIILLFTALLSQLLLFMNNQRSMTAKLATTGVFTYILLQSVLNIAMNLGIAPVTGVTLPLISYGGSSIIATYISLGIVTSASRDSHTQAKLEIK